jgi:hypothetical protein
MNNNNDNQTWKSDQDKEQELFNPSNSGVDSISKEDEEFIRNESEKPDSRGAVSRYLMKTGDKLDEIKKDSRKLNVRLKKYKEDLEKTDKLIVGVMIFSVISFLGFMSTLWYDAITNKKLYDQKYSLYKDYSEKNFELIKEIKYQNINIKDLKNKIEVLRAKN